MGGGRAFDEGWSLSELLSTSHGWVDDNSWADDFLPLSIIFNGVRDRLLTETNPDGFWKKQHGADSDGYMRRYHSGDNESYLTQHRGDGTPAGGAALSTTPIVQTRLSITSHFLNFFFFSFLLRIRTSHEMINAEAGLLSLRGRHKSHSTGTTKRWCFVFSWSIKLTGFKCLSHCINSITGRSVFSNLHLCSHE